MNKELEERLTFSSYDERKLKKKLFDIEMERLLESKRRAASEEEAARYAKLGRYVQDKYNKYANRNIRDFK